MKKLGWLMMAAVTGCSVLQPVADDPVRHLLEATVSPGKGVRSRPAAAVGRPSLPPYLERVELVTRTGDGRLEIHEKELWAEPLDGGIARVVADNLRRLKGSANIQPSANFVAREYSSLVEIRIERFDPLPDGTLVLEATWKMQPIGANEAAPKSFRVVVPILSQTEGMGGRIVAMNEALERLSRSIADSL